MRYMDFDLCKYFVLSLCMLIAGLALKHYNLCLVAFVFAYVMPKQPRNERRGFAACVVFACVGASTWRYMTYA